MTTTRTQADLIALLTAKGLIANDVLALVMSAARETGKNSRGEVVANPAYVASLMPAIRAMGAAASAERMCQIVDASAIKSGNATDMAREIAVNFAL